MAMLIDGKKLAQDLKDQLRLGTPQGGLGVIVIGDNPASAIYIQHKEKVATELGIPFSKLAIPADTPAEEVKKQMQDFVAREDLAGIILQLPVPASLPVNELLRLIPLTKDIDGLLPGSPYIAATARAVMHAITSTQEVLTGKHAVMIGYSNLLGKALVDLLIAAQCTVSITHIHTRNLSAITQQADILISAVGKPGLVTGDMVKAGCIAIDVGISRTADGIKGDMDFETVAKKAQYITPVPGGIGPLTIIFLLANLLRK